MIGKSNNWRGVLVLLWILNINVKSEIIEKPVDTEVGIGESTHLNCSTSDASEDINWHHQPVDRGSNDLRYVFMSGQMLRPYDERFRIETDSSTGAFNLVITNVEVEDAGRYICQNGGPPATAELIVLESLPMCMSNINSNGFIGPNSCGLMKEKIQLSCGVKYHGNVPPRLQWKRKQHGKSFPISEPCVASDGRFTCNYTADADMEMDGTSFICQSNRSIDTQYNCTTETVKILYSSENKTRIAKTVGDEMTCSANTSSTDCSYKWIWFDGIDQETVSESRALAIIREGYHRCEATCAIKDFRCLVNAMTIKAFDPPAKDTTTAVIVGCVVTTIALGCLCLIAFLVVYIKRKGDSRKDLIEQEHCLISNTDDNEALKKEIRTRDAQIEELQLAVAALTRKAEINEAATDRKSIELSEDLLTSKREAKTVDIEANHDENEDKRTMKKPLETLRSDKEPKNSDGDKQSQWACKNCTYDNRWTDASCSMCSASKSHEDLTNDEKTSSETCNETETKPKRSDQYLK